MMKLNKVLLLACVFAVTFFPIHNAMALPITVTNNYVGSVVYEDSASFVDTYTGTTLGTQTVTATSASGKTSSTSTFSYSGDATRAIISLDVSHRIDNNGYETRALAQSFESFINFTADDDTTFSISGIYDMQGGATMMLSSVFFQDLSATTLLMQEFEYSEYTANETFEINGASDGDRSNAQVGSLSGNLIAGHNYRFYSNMYIDVYADTSGIISASNSATGNVTLTIGTSASISEPSLLALLSIGLFGMGVVRKCSKH